MNESPAERIARLQRELADAKVAQVQAELDEARQQTGAPGAPPPPPSYGGPPPQDGAPPNPGAYGQTPWPGQAAGPGQAGGFGQTSWPGQAAWPGQTPPYGGSPQQPGIYVQGTQVDPSSFFPGSAFQGGGFRRISANPMMGMLGAQGFGTFGNQAYQPVAPTDTNLAPTPRRVPMAYRLLVLPFSFWTVFTLFMIAVAPIALWIEIPISAVIVGIGTFVVVIALKVRKEQRVTGLLKWGEIAEVTGIEVLGSGTYYSGTTYSNMRMSQAHGWDVERHMYSGPGTSTLVHYRLHGTEGQLHLHGLPYDNGIILAHAKKPQRAMCISSIPYDLDRTPDGQWSGAVRTRTFVGSIAMFVVLAGWTAAMVGLFGVAAEHLHRWVR